MTPLLHSSSIWRHFTNLQITKKRFFTTKTDFCCVESRFIVETELLLTAISPGKQQSLRVSLLLLRMARQDRQAARHLKSYTIECEERLHAILIWKMKESVRKAPVVLFFWGLPGSLWHLLCIEYICTNNDKWSYSSIYNELQLQKRAASSLTCRKYFIAKRACSAIWIIHRTRKKYKFRCISTHLMALRLPSKHTTAVLHIHFIL